MDVLCIYRIDCVYVYLNMCRAILNWLRAQTEHLYFENS